MFTVEETGQEALTQEQGEVWREWVELGRPFIGAGG